jgi:hypothetical protein
MKKDLGSFFAEASGDEDFQIRLRSLKSVEDIIEEASTRGFDFSEAELISHFAETLTRSNDDLASFLKYLMENQELQDRMRMINTSEGIVAVASQLGYDFTAPDLINHFAETLLQADDAQTVILFDSFGWDFRSLLGVLQQTHGPVLTNP